MNPASNALTPEAPTFDLIEAAISRYETMAKEHYAVAPNGHTTIDKARQAQLDKSLKHLENERKKLDTIIDVQAKLEKYRSEGLMVTDSSIGSHDRDELIKAMTSEAHHPTAILEKHMLADGKPKPSPKHTAHHIVPGKGKLPGVNYNTRIHIHQFGIRINDPINGVYLVSNNADTPHWSMPNSGGHKKYHTHGYERWVNRRVTRKFSLSQIKVELQVVGRILQNNPPEAIKDKV